MSDATTLDAWGDAFDREHASELLHEQPPPTAGTGDMWAEVLMDEWVQATCSDDLLADMRERRAFGIAKHGGPVRLDDGRDRRADCYQELLDGIVYAHRNMRVLEMRGHAGGAATWRFIRDGLMALADHARVAP